MSELLPAREPPTRPVPAAHSSPHPARPQLLHYRPWRGVFRPPAASVWPIARVSLGMIFRRRLFWVLYGLGSLFFLMFFFGQYLLAFFASQSSETEVRAGLLGRLKPIQMVQLIRNTFKLNGSADTYANFFWYQGYVVMIVLALAGSILVGNDLRFGSLPYYLSKPLSRRHYLLGKGLAVAVFINLMTTLPAVVLYVQDWLLYSEGSLFTKGHLLVGILAYGAVLTVSLTLVLLATATWVRRTVPLIMTWTTLFVFCRFATVALVDRLPVGERWDPRWRLIDLWNDAYLVGSWCLGMDPRPRQPAWYEAALVLGGVSLLCLIYLVRRIRAVEIVR
jgi:ABC-type transport system involved in multi-copper enzyme maturation permease subunit